MKRPARSGPDRGRARGRSERVGLGLVCALAMLGMLALGLLAVLAGLLGMFARGLDAVRRLGSGFGAGQGQGHDHQGGRENRSQ